MKKIVVCLSILSVGFLFSFHTERPPKPTPPSITLCKSGFVPTMLSTRLGIDLIKHIQAEPIRTRKNIYTMTATDIDTYRKAVAQMKQWSTTNPNDPIGWTYQAAIHKTNATPVQALWNQCPHHVPQEVFLAWHRVYLYFFERILRKAAQTAGVTTATTFALPYWNYSNTGQDKLPSAFRVPKNNTNALYDSKRVRGINAGNALPPSIVDVSSPLATTSFTGTINTGFNRTVESIPHDPVHGTIGGATGDMGAFETAALDPIFWLHHANIDRLWEAWLRQGGRANPTTNTSWMNTPYTFFDENRHQVTLTISQILDVQNQLHYRYDDVPTISPIIAPPIAMQQNPKRTKLFMQQSFTIAQNLNKTELNNFTNLNEMANKKSIADKATKSHYILSLEDIDVAEIPDGVYEIYICLPSTIKNPTHKSHHYVGIFSTIGVQRSTTNAQHHNEPMEYDVTNQVRRLRETNVDVSKFTVTFKLVSGDTNPKKGNITIKHISLYAEN